MFISSHFLHLSVAANSFASRLTRIQRWQWLRVDRLLGEHGIPQDSAAGRRHLEGEMEQRRAAEESADHPPIRRGWCFGNEAFRKELLTQIAERMGSEHYREERRES